MASNDASNFAENTSKGTHVDKQKEKKLAQIAELLEGFLSKNMAAWMQTKASFPKYHLDACKNTGKINVKLIKSILVLAYLHRRNFWKMLQANFKLIVTSPESYMLFRTIPNDHYMFHYLVHLACLYEMVAYAFTKGYCIDNCLKACILKFTDHQCFIKQGGLKKLYDASNNISGFYDALVQPFGVKFPDIDILTPFSRAVNIVERHLRCKDFANQVQNKRNAEENTKYNQKLQALISFGIQKFTSGYMSVNKNLREDKDTTSNLETQMKNMSVDHDCSSVTSDETDLKGNKEIVVSSSSSDKHVDTTENEAANNVADCGLDDSTFLVVSENFCQKYIHSMKYNQKFNWKSNVKIICPQCIKEVTLFSRKTFVDIYQNFELFIIAEGIYALGRKYIENSEKDAIILDTSSEEEDELDSYGESIKRHNIKCFREFSLYDLRKMKLLINEYTKKGDLLNLLYTSETKEKKTKNRRRNKAKKNCPDQMKPGSNTNSSGDITKTKSSNETKPGSSTYSTGAIPKAIAVQMKNESIIGQNRTPTTSYTNAVASPHSSTSDMSNTRRIRAKETRHTTDGKREWRKEPVKRN